MASRYDNFTDQVQKGPHSTFDSCIHAVFLAEFTWSRFLKPPFHVHALLLFVSSHRAVGINPLTGPGQSPGRGQGDETPWNSGNLASEGTEYRPKTQLRIRGSFSLYKMRRKNHPLMFQTRPTSSAQI